MTKVKIARKHWTDLDNVFVVETSSAFTQNVI